MNRDLTVGAPGKVLRQFCIPLFGSVIFQQIYNIADSIIAGKFINEEALAAVGNSYEITLIFIAFGFGLNIGCSVLVSRLFGAKNFESLKTAISTAFIVSGAVCAALMVLGLLLGGPLLHAIDTPANIFQDSCDYLRIYCLGLPFVFFYNLSNGIFSALGDSRTPFIFLAASSTANIFMDIWFVAGLDMGVPGVAWATFICQGISCILALVFVFRRLKKMELPGIKQWFSKTMFIDFIMVAIPSILQQSFVSIGNIFIQRFVNGFGSGVIAGYSAAIKLNNLVIVSFTTIGNGVSNYTAQNLGAEKYDRLNLGLKAAVRMVWTMCIPVIALYFLAGGGLVGFFINEPTEAAMNTGVLILRILSPFYFIVAAKLMMDGLLRGAMRMKDFMAGTFTDLLLRVVLAFFFSGTALGSTGIWIAWPIGWIVATMIAGGYYLKFRKDIKNKSDL